MIILLWFTTILLLVSFSIVLILYLIKSPHTKESLQTLLNGFKEGLNWCGFFMRKNRYPVELYKWVAMNDDEVCEECLERVFWEPMDIADWMKEGLPRTPEAETSCGHACRCELVPVQKTAFTKKVFKQ